MMPKIFLCYRRSDSAILVGRIYDRLVARYGLDSVFVDTGSIRVGHDFLSEILSAIQKCSVFMAIIGPRWERNEDGAVTLDNLRDYVHLEIEEASKWNKKIISITFQRDKPIGAGIPKSVIFLTKLQSVNIDVGRNFDNDFERLMASIDREIWPSPWSRLIRRTLEIFAAFKLHVAIVTSLLVVLYIMRSKLLPMVVDHEVVKPILARVEPSVYGKSSNGMCEYGRLFHDRQALVEGTDLPSAIAATHKTLDVFAINATAIFNQSEALEAALRNGARIRFILLDHSEGNLHFVRSLYTNGEFAGSEFESSLTEQALALIESKILVTKIAANPTLYPGSLEVKTWPHPLFFTFWVRDPMSPKECLGHMEILRYGDMKLNSSVRFGPSAPLMVKSLSEHFESLWLKSTILSR